mgnify:CR=1 FL=1|jgi:cytochrome c-type protein NapB
MNGKKTLIFAMALTTLAAFSPLSAQENVATMRGATDINETAVLPQANKWQGKSPRIARQFSQQPPLIPHKSQNFKINLKQNKCMSCHGLESYEAKGAVKVSDTHFIDRDGKKLAQLSSSRYFCTQCHVEQRDVEPLVGNDFKP